MTIQIKKLKINRNGPLQKDFEIEPGKLNLIYGHNESGKTFLVEGLIELLFQNKKNKLETRDWDITGRIQISGLSQKTESFTKSSKKKLDQIWEEDSQLPKDLSSLLVIKGGETTLQKNAADGIGHSFLKNFLSAEGILDEIEKNISKTLQNAKIENKDINGDNRGDINQRNDLIKEKEEIESLLKEVEQTHASTSIQDIDKSIEILNSKIEVLEVAKCYKAFKINESINELKKEKSEIEKTNLNLNPDIIADLKAKRKHYETEENKIKEEKDNLKDHKEDYEWLENAKTNYLKFLQNTEKSSYDLYFWITCFFLIVTGIATFLYPGWIPFTTTILSIIFFILFSLKFKEKRKNSLYKNELTELKKEYKKRFNKELTNLTTLETKFEVIKEKQNEYKRDKEALEKREKEQDEHREDIEKLFGKLGHQELEINNWKSKIEELGENLARNNDSIDSKKDEIYKRNLELEGLKVPREKFLEKPTNLEWNENEYENLKESKIDKEKSKRDKEEEMNFLRAKVWATLKSQEEKWEDLIPSLRKVLQEKENAYIEKTAEIISKIKIHSIVKEFREKENERIEEGLQRKEVRDALFSITRNYHKIRKEKQEGLIVINNEDEEFSISKLSTGAKDQVFLALRTGFAKLSLQSQSAFLILDDAFQHSDWERRENLVFQIIELTKLGWQIFYFTMDDHLKKLFQTECKKLGDSFKFIELSNKNSIS
tara:strand:+ start:14039 stop:16186 length:2148 start_codon:yes stop_codon:yes gene_type:complete